MIRKRGDKWYFRTSVTVDGEIKRIERVGGKTKKECQIALAKFETEILKGSKPVTADALTLEQFSQYWMDHYVSDLSESTQISYRKTLKNHVLPKLGKKKLPAIKPIDIQELINSKKELSKGTLSVILSTMHCIFRYAVVPCGHILANPADGVKVPKSQKPQFEAHVWTKDELAIIFDKFNQSHDFWLPLTIMYHTGCRIGETLALGWDDIDLYNDTIHIHRTMRESGVISPTVKSLSSVRTIPFSSKLHKILKSVRNAQIKLSKELKRDFPLVCCRNNARRISVQDMKWFNKWCKNTFGHGSMHSFRHTHATMLLEAGESLEMVSKRLGHSNMHITSKYYSKILEQRTKRMVETLETF